MITSFERVEEFCHVRELTDKRRQTFSVTTNPVYKIQRRYKVKYRSLSTY
jgi:hypothetical protein